MVVRECSAAGSTWVVTSRTTWRVPWLWCGKGDGDVLPLGHRRLVLLRPSYRMAVAAAGVLLAGVSSVHAADFSTWQKKLQIRFAGYNKPETLSDFPALVVFSTNTAGLAYNQF